GRGRQEGAASGGVGGAVSCSGICRLSKRMCDVVEYRCGGRNGVVGGGFLWELERRERSEQGCGLVEGAVGRVGGREEVRYKASGVAASSLLGRICTDWGLEVAKENAPEGN